MSADPCCASSSSYRILVRLVRGAAILRDAFRRCQGAPPSPDRDRTARRAGRALERNGDEDVGELPDAITRQLAQVEVLVVEDAVPRQQLLVDGTAHVGIRIRLDLRRPRVGADADDLAIGHPPRDLEADARLAGVELRVVLHPETPPPRAAEHELAGSDF